MADDYLFPTMEDLSPDKVFGLVDPNITTGPYPSYTKLLTTQIGLMREDFLRAINEQVNQIRAEPAILKTRACFEVTTGRVREKRMGRFVHQLGIDMHFDADKYKDVKWDAEKKFMNGNLVFLTKDKMQDIILGVIHDSKPYLLRKGVVVIQLCCGVKDTMYFKALDHHAHQSSKFKLVEARAFYFPYLHVTNVLRAELLRIRVPEVVFPLSSISNSADEKDNISKFYEELVLAKFPSKHPKTLALSQSFKGEKILKTIDNLNDSQREALHSVLNHRVALVQGPPGTGKTHLACKIAECFVKLKREFPVLLPGPILVTTTTNHAVDEFLIRCCDFSEKIIHGYSQFHETKDYGPLQVKYNKASFKEKNLLLGEAEILAMTTSRVAYMKKNLESLNIKVVIVEEAAEALEAHILACITNTTEHLIQIGDHKQLRPTPSHQELARTSHFDISLFERLIRNGADCPMLNQQRRMRPLIARLVKCIYPSLENDDCTRGRPTVVGVDLKTPVFFLNHNEPETPEGTGYFNQVEAEMAVRLANYLLVSGYQPHNVTVLTTYRRQLIHVMNAAKSIGGEVKDVRMTTVDNFQGEECDIIILSLVRSNLEGNIGFMALENRACVALSRARNGFFLLGNLGCFRASESAVWKHVDKTLTEANKIGDELPLNCLHDKKFLVKTAEDVKMAERGCVVCDIKRSYEAAVKILNRTINKIGKAKKEVEKVEKMLRTANSSNNWEEEEMEQKRSKLQELKAWQEKLNEELPIRIEEESIAKERWSVVEPLYTAGTIDITDTLETVETKLRFSLFSRTKDLKSLFKAMHDR